MKYIRGTLTDITEEDTQMSCIYGSICDVLYDTTIIDDIISSIGHDEYIRNTKLANKKDIMEYLSDKILDI
jgi:hypothetical protein